MATKRTKADKSQRQSDRLEKKSERRPEQGISTRKVRKMAMTSLVTALALLLTLTLNS